MQETWVRSLEKEMATHFSILAWRIPWIVHEVTMRWTQLSDFHFQLLPRWLSSLQSLSHVQFCDPVDCSTSSFPVYHQLPEFAQTHVHSISSVQLLSYVRLFVTPRTAACKASLFITNSRTPSKPISIESVMPSNHLILCRPLLLLPSVSQCQGLSNESVLCHGIGVSGSASVLPMNIQDWFPLGCTGWISLQSQGLSRVFSNTTVQKHQFFSA